MDVQKILDAWLAANPEIQTYLSAIFYIAPGTTTPAAATHVLGLGNRRGQGLTIGLAVNPPYDVAIDSILAAINMPPIVLPEPGSVAIMPS